MNTTQHPTPRRRRAYLVGAALLAAAVAGAAIPAIAHGPGEHMRGEHMMREDGQPHRGWMHGGGMQGGGMHHDGMFRDGPRGGRGMMFGPGSVERMVDRLARATDASSDQRQKMNAIAQAAAQELTGVRQRHRAGREQLRAILTAPTIDRGKLETLRAEQIKLADEASRRITTAIADIAEVLNPAQREELGRWLERRHGRRM